MRDEGAFPDPGEAHDGDDGIIWSFIRLLLVQSGREVGELKTYPMLGNGGSRVCVEEGKPFWTVASAGLDFDGA